MYNRIKKFEIHLDRDLDDKYQYEPGETVRGQVVLITSGVLNLDAILVQIRGDAMVSLNDDESGGGTGARSLASETYIDVTMDLLNHETVVQQSSNERPIISGESRTRTNTRVLIPPGEHRYPLSYPLPLTIPSSFAGKFGSITYVVRATLTEDRRLSLGATVCSEPFLVQRVLDVSSGLGGKVRNDRTVSVTKRVFGSPWFCLVGTITASFTIDKDVYSPGDDVIIQAKITNDSADSIEVVHTQLNLNSSYGANKLLYNHTLIINMRTDACRIDFDETHDWKNVRMPIPLYMPESGLEGCELIDIDYELVFRIDLESGRNVTATIPLAVGNIIGRKCQTGKKSLMNLESAERSTVEGNGYEWEDEVINIFRHPIDPGKTRQNLLFDGGLYTVV